jgi:hypothetical protein
VLALVVYESMFGNTEEVAKAVAQGLRSTAEVRLFEIADAPDVIGPDVHVLVVGGPTHAFGMSRPGTRADAASRADVPIVSRAEGLREWIASVELPDRLPVAAFDTKVAHPRLPGSAARRALRRLHHRGAEQVVAAATFHVEGMTGPLLEGELDRATLWGHALAQRVPVPH